MGREDLNGDPRFETQAARTERPKEVDAIIAAWTRKHTKEEAMKVIGAAGVPAGAVFDTLELMNDPSFAERGIMQTIEHRPPARSRCRRGRCVSTASHRR